MPPPDGANYGGRRRTVFEVITEAVRDFEIHGYDSQRRLDVWLERIRAAAYDSLMSPERVAEMVNDGLAAIYTKAVERGGLLRLHPGVSRFTLERIKPKLRAELDRRILASANLIKMNRAAAVNTVLQRFAGWSTSIPAGGSEAIDKVTVKTDLRKSIADLPYVERRVAIDQGHKLSSAVSSIVAADGGAIAAVWHSHFRQAGYNYRPDHKQRDGRTYAIRESWAMQRGLMKVGRDGYTDDLTQPGEEVFCRCNYRYVYALRDLPPEMITAGTKLYRGRAVPRWRPRSRSGGR